MSTASRTGPIARTVSLRNLQGTRSKSKVFLSGFCLAPWDICINYHNGVTQLKYEVDGKKPAIYLLTSLASVQSQLKLKQLRAHQFARTSMTPAGSSMEHSKATEDKATTFSKARTTKWSGIITLTAIPTCPYLNSD